MAPGAILAAAGWLAATSLLPFYVTLAGEVSPTLGALGGLIVLVWIYLLTISLLTGAELNAVRGPTTTTGRRRGARRGGP